MPRSPGGRLEAGGKVVGARLDWSGATRARATRLAARSAWFGMGVVGSYGTYYQPQFFPLTADDSLGTSDAATQATTLVPRTASDSLGTSDAAAGAVARTRSASDSLGSSDAATRAPTGAARSGADSLGTSDAATRAPTVAARSASDSLGTSDATTATYSRGRFAADALGNYPSTILRDSPSRYYRLAEVGASTSAFEEAGRTVRSFVYGAAVQRGFPSLVANDSNDRSVFSPDVNNTEINPVSGGLVGSGTLLFEGIASRTTSTGVDSLFFSSNSGSAFCGVVVQAGSNDVALLNETGTLKTWANAWPGLNVATHWACEISGANHTAELFINGVSMGQVTGLPALDAGVWYFGGNPGRGFYWSGYIDEVATWTSALANRAARIALHASAAALGGGGVSDAATRLFIRGVSDVLGTSDAAARAPLAQPRTASDTLAASTYDPVIDADSPVSHWKLGSASSAVDRKGVTDLPAVGGPISAAATLVVNNGNNVSNRFVRASSQLFGKANSSGQGAPYEAPSWSVEAWFSPASSPGTTVGVVGRDSHQAIRITGANAIQLRWRDAADLGDAIGTVVAVVGVTYHVVGVFDGTNAILYVNGVENTRKATSSRSVPDGVPSVASLSTDTSFCFDGTIDEVGWYTTALSPARVLAHYQAGTVPAPIDVATRALALPRVAADSLGTSDAAVATTSGVPTRTASDSLGTSDAASRAATVRSRSAADALGTSDAATRASTVRARTASDTAGHGNGQQDQLNTDTRASYAAFGAGAPDWSGSGWQTGGKPGGYYLMAAPVAWGNGDDTIKVRAKLIVFGSLATVGVGFVKPGSIAQGSVLLAEIFNGSLTLAYNGPWNVGGGTTITTIAIPGYVAGNYYVVELTRAGNSVVVGVRDATDTSIVLANQTVALPAGAQADYGAGVALRPMLSLSNLSSTGTGADWWEFGSPADVATRVLALVPRSAADALGTNDAATRTTAQPRSASDSLGTSDAATRAPTARARNATDTLGTTDAATGARTLPRTGSDALGTSDVAVRATTVRSRFASDTLGTSDVAVSTPLRTANDFLGTSDAATRAPTIRGRSASDTLGSSDAATRAAIAGARSSSDVLGTSDLATQVASYARFSDDVLGSSDVATQTVSFGRLASDTLGTDDQAERLVVVSFRFAADELGTTDSALAFIPRFASDTLGTSDVATIALLAQVLGTVLVSDSPSSLLSISDRPQLELALSSSALTISDEPA